MAEFAGDYDLQYIHLHNHRGEGLENGTRGENISAMVIELNVYESLYNHAITGSLVIVDTRNLIGNLPIQGTERLSFRLATKLDTYSSADSIDFTEERGNPMHVYKLANREQVNDTTQSYTLHFCSREFLRNMRTKVSESFTGRMDEAVYSIFKRPEYLDSKKKLFFQKTRNQDKIVIPNVSPVDAIKLLAKRSLPSNLKDTGGAGYLFYETTKGFHFRSWESLCADKNGTPRDAEQRYRFVQAKTGPNPHDNSKTKDREDRVTDGYRNVRDYKFINNFHDVATNTRLGTYGHRVITHNIYDKSYREDDYHYHNRWNQTNHLEINPAITESPVDYDTKEGTPYNKGVSDYPESRVSLQSTARFTHDENTGNFGTPIEDDGKLEGARRGQINNIHLGTKLQMTVNGQTRLQAGDVIDFDLQSVENKDTSGGRLDPQYSGRYIITDIRHRVAQEKFLQVLTCVKDSSKEGYGYESGKSFTEISGGTPKRTPRTIDINKNDENFKSTSKPLPGVWHPGV